MSFINGPVFTSAGKALHARAVAGATLTFTKMQLGDGNRGTASIESLTRLVSPVASVGIASLRHNANTAYVTGIFTNADLSVGFYWREIGLFAADPDNPNDRSKDILYCYQDAAGNADYIPASDSSLITKRISVAAITDNAASVSAVFGERTSAADAVFDNAGTSFKSDTVQGVIAEIDTELKKKYDPNNKPTAADVGAVPDERPYIKDGNILEWAVSQTGERKCICNTNVTGLPKTGHWMVELEYSPQGVWRILTVTDILTQEKYENNWNNGEWTGWLKRLDGNTTAADVGAAPAGFGLGATAKYLTSEDDLNTIFQSGWYMYGQSKGAPQNIPNPGGLYLGQYGLVQVIAYSSDSCVQIAYNMYDVSRDNLSAMRTIDNGIGEWEWVNPPMTAGYEYRTTERMNGKAVYKRNNGGVIQYRLDGETTWKPYAEAVGALHAGNTNQTKLVSTATTPTVNGQINWTYE